MLSVSYDGIPLGDTEHAIERATGRPAWVVQINYSSGAAGCRSHQSPHDGNISKRSPETVGGRDLGGVGIPPFSGANYMVKAGTPLSTTSMNDPDVRDFRCTLLGWPQRSWLVFPSPPCGVVVNLSSKTRSMVKATKNTASLVARTHVLQFAHRSDYRYTSSDGKSHNTRVEFSA